MLSEDMRIEVKEFMKMHQDWQEGILRNGRRSGEPTFKEPPARFSRVIFNALQGTLLVQRFTSDPSQLEDVIKAIKQLWK